MGGAERRAAAGADPPRRASIRSGTWHEAAVFARDQLHAGHKVAGPAIVIEPHQTVVVEDGWQAEIDA